MKCYLRNLQSTDMAKKASLEVENLTLNKLLIYTEQLEAGLQRYQSLGRVKEPMDVSPLLNPLREIQSALAAVAVDQQQLRADIDRSQRTSQAESSRQKTPQPRGNVPTGRERVGQQQTETAHRPWSESELLWRYIHHLPGRHRG